MITMKAFPQINENTILMVIKTEAKTYRILIDGDVHPLLTGFETVEEAVVVRSVIGDYHNLDVDSTMALSLRQVQDDLSDSTTASLGAAKYHVDSKVADKCMRYREMAFVLMNEDAVALIKKLVPIPPFVGWPTI